MKRGSRRARSGSAAERKTAPGTPGPVLLVLALALAGCGAKKPTEEETAPLRVAIEAYLREKNMGMKPDTFESLAIEGDAATAEVRMAAKDVAYGMRPRWTFTFRKEGDAWTVTAVKR